MPGWDRAIPHYDVIILGAGAAGLLCAMTAGGRGRKVLLLDHANEPGKKILISGGGRCNFTNLDAHPDRFFSNNPHFSKSALARYTQHDFIALVEKHGIAWHEKTLGQLFCDGSARAVVAMLLAECAAASVAVRVLHSIGEITRSDRFHVATDKGDFTSQSLVLATGGPSIPKMGATGFAYRVAEQFGLKLVPPRPALVPLVFDGEDLALMQPLAGVATEVIASCNRRSFRENMLFTHRGLSGPAILQISSVWQPGEAITIDLQPNHDVGAFLQQRKRVRPNAELKTVLGEFLPQRLATMLVQAGYPDRPIGNTTDRDLQRLAGQLKSWTLTPSGTEGYAKAEVTIGGVDTKGLSSRSMEANDVPGLYVIGEAVDVTVGWAATTSNGPGPAAGAPAWRSDRLDRMDIIAPTDHEHYSDTMIRELLKSIKTICAGRRVQQPGAAQLHRDQIPVRARLPGAAGQSRAGWSDHRRLAGLSLPGGPAGAG